MCLVISAKLLHESGAIEVHPFGRQLTRRGEDVYGADRYFESPPGRIHALPSPRMATAEHLFENDRLFANVSFHFSNCQFGEGPIVAEAKALMHLADQVPAAKGLAVQDEDRILGKGGDDPIHVVRVLRIEVRLERSGLRHLILPMRGGDLSRARPPSRAGECQRAPIAISRFPSGGIVRTEAPDGRGTM